MDLLLQKKYDLMNRRKALLDEAKAMLLKDGKTPEYTAKMADVEDLNGQIEAVEDLIVQAEKAFQGGQPDLHGMQGQGGSDGGQEGGSGYEKAVKAFAAAARSGFRVTEKAAGDMLQEGVDADGGYTVPADIVTRIIELRDAKESLLREVNVIPVTTKSGKRTFKKRSQHDGFATVAETAKYGKAATPQFTTVAYEIEKRGGYMATTAELYEDSDNNIAAVAETWLGDESRVTANKEILAVIQTKEAVDLVDLDGILKAWVGLGSVFRATSKLITNDDGLLYLGTRKDANGRYLLTPNPADPQQLRLCIGPYTLPVKTYDNKTIPSNGTQVPMILGDLKEGVAYWDRESFSIKLSDVAVVGDLNAYEQDLILWRGSLRDDCTPWDDEAFVNGYLDTAAKDAATEGAAAEGAAG